MLAQKTKQFLLFFVSIIVWVVRQLFRLVRKIILHLLFFVYLIASVVHQFYFDEAYKLLGIKGSMQFTRVWPLIGLVLLVALWVSWVMSDYRHIKSRRPTKTKSPAPFPTSESSNPTSHGKSRYTPDEEYLRND